MQNKKSTILEYHTAWYTLHKYNTLQRNETWAVALVQADLKELKSKHNNNKQEKDRQLQLKKCQRKVQVQHFQVKQSAWLQELLAFCSKIPYSCPLAKSVTYIYLFLQLDRLDLNLCTAG